MNRRDFLWQTFCITAGLLISPSIPQDDFADNVRQLCETLERLVSEYGLSDYWVVLIQPEDYKEYYKDYIQPLPSDVWGSGWQAKGFRIPPGYPADTFSYVHRDTMMLPIILLKDDQNANIDFGIELFSQDKASEIIRKFLVTYRV